MPDRADQCSIERNRMSRAPFAALDPDVAACSRGDAEPHMRWRAALLVAIAKKFLNQRNAVRQDLIHAVRFLHRIEHGSEYGPKSWEKERHRVTINSANAQRERLRETSVGGQVNQSRRVTERCGKRSEKRGVTVIATGAIFVQPVLGSTPESVSRF